MILLCGVHSLTAAQPATAAEMIIIGKPVVAQQFHGLNQPMVLPRTRYLVASRGDRLGTTIHWMSGPFVNTRNPKNCVDSRLEISTPGGKGSALSVLVARDETHVADGDRTASVSAQVVRPGMAGAILQVTFLTGDASAVASGVYTTRVVGTITGH